MVLRRRAATLTAAAAVAASLAAGVAPANAATRTPTEFFSTEAFQYSLDHFLLAAEELSSNSYLHGASTGERDVTNNADDALQDARGGEASTPTGPFDGLLGDVLELFDAGGGGITREIMESSSKKQKRRQQQEKEQLPGFSVKEKKPTSDQGESFAVGVIFATEDLRIRDPHPATLHTAAVAATVEERTKAGRSEREGGRGEERGSISVMSSSPIVLLDCGNAVLHPEAKENKRGVWEFPSYVESAVDEEGNGDRRDTKEEEEKEDSGMVRNIVSDGFGAVGEGGKAEQGPTDCTNYGEDDFALVDESLTVYSSSLSGMDEVEMSNFLIKGSLKNPPRERLTDQFLDCMLAYYDQQELSPESKSEIEWVSYPESETKLGPVSEFMSVADSEAESEAESGRYFSPYQSQQGRAANSPVSSSGDGDGGGGGGVTVDGIPSRLTIPNGDLPLSPVLPSTKHWVLPATSSVGAAGVEHEEQEQSGQIIQAMLGREEQQQQQQRQQHHQQQFPEDDAETLDSEVEPKQRGVETLDEGKVAMKVRRRGLQSSSSSTFFSVDVVATVVSPSTDWNGATYVVAVGAQVPGQSNSNGYVVDRGTIAKGEASPYRKTITLERGCYVIYTTPGTRPYEVEWEVQMEDKLYMGTKGGGADRQTFGVGGALCSMSTCYRNCYVGRNDRSENECASFGDLLAPLDEPAGANCDCPDDEKLDLRLECLANESCNPRAQCYYVGDAVQQISEAKTLRVVTYVTTVNQSINKNGMEKVVAQWLDFDPIYVTLALVNGVAPLDDSTDSRRLLQRHQGGYSVKTKKDKREARAHAKGKARLGRDRSNLRRQPSSKEQEQEQEKLQRAVKKRGLQNTATVAFKRLEFLIISGTPVDFLDATETIKGGVRGLNTVLSVQPEEFGVETVDAYTADYNIRNEDVLTDDIPDVAIAGSNSGEGVDAAGDIVVATEAPAVEPEEEFWTSTQFLVGAWLVVVVSFMLSIVACIVCHMKRKERKEFLKKNASVDGRPKPIQFVDPWGSMAVTFEKDSPQRRNGSRTANGSMATV